MSFHKGGMLALGKFSVVSVAGLCALHYSLLYPPSKWIIEPRSESSNVKAKCFHFPMLKRKPIKLHDIIVNPKESIIVKDHEGCQLHRSDEIWGIIAKEAITHSKHNICR